MGHHFGIILKIFFLWPGLTGQLTFIPGENQLGRILYISGIIATNGFTSAADFVSIISGNQRVQKALLNRLCWVNVTERLFVREKAVSLSTSIKSVMSTRDARAALDSVL